MKNDTLEPVTELDHAEPLTELEWRDFTSENNCGEPEIILIPDFDELVTILG